jgi:hypothetical protein
VLKSKVTLRNCHPLSILNFNRKSQIVKKESRNE